MERKESAQVRNKKKTTFKPIMLTSKQIKPVDRSNVTNMRCQRKISSKKADNNEEDVGQRKKRYSYVAYSNSVNRSQMIKKLTQQYRDQLLKKISNHKQMSRNFSNNKSIPTSVIKVQFQGYQNSSFTNNRYDNNIMDFQHPQPRSLQKFMYFTNAKTYDSFSKPGKIKFSSRNGFPFSRSTKRQNHKTNQKDDQILDDLMNQHYLNVKKVNPKQKYLGNNKDHVGQQKMQEITKKVQEYQNTLLKKFDQKYRSTTVMLNRKSPQKQKISVPHSPYNNQIPLSQQTKIQEDILAKRHQNKKQYFVFGMGQTSSKTNFQPFKYRFQFYKDFLWKINFTNGIYVKIKDQIQNPYKLFVGKGNNSMLIKGIARRRPWWQIVDKVSDQVNFVWTQLKINQFYSFQKQFGQKKKIFTIKNRKTHSSLESTAQGRKILLKSQKLMERLQTWQLNQNDLNSCIMMGNDYDLWLNHYKINKKYQEKLENYLGKRVKTLVRKKNLLYISQSNKLKIQNHFEKNFFLGNKKALYYSMKHYYEITGRNIFDYLPITFHISKGIDDPEYEKFLNLFYEFDQKKKRKEVMNVWIIKPGQYTNRGKGITVCSSLDDIKIRLKGKQRSKNGKSHTFIVQKYIQKPLLYFKRKFDIRHFMLMTCTNGKFKGYWYSQGYIRTSSFEYNIKNCKDLYTHLTNDSVQQNSSDYGKFQKGNKLSYQEFQKYLNQYFRKSKGQDCYMQKIILPKMKAIAKGTMEASYMLMSPKRYQHNFELFGLDFMIDQDLNVYLIEVNTNPCLQTSCTILSKIISTLIENVFKICVDPLFPPPYEWPSQKKYQLGDNALEQNKFTLIFDENVLGDQLKKLYQKVQLTKGIEDIQQQQQEYDDEGKQWQDD